MLLKKESFLVADEGGEPVESLPPGKLSVLGDELIVLELCPEASVPDLPAAVFFCSLLSFRN